MSIDARGAASSPADGEPASTTGAPDAAAPQPVVRARSTSAPVGRTKRARADLGEAIEGAQAGDEGDFVRIYRDVHPTLLRYLWTLVREDCEDVAADTWVQVCRDLRKFRGDSNGFRAWVATIGRNRALDHLRRQGRRRADPVPPEQLRDIAGRDDTAATALDALSTASAVAMIASLPHDQAEAVMLRAVLGLDAKAAGRILGKRPGAVRTSTYRGLKTLAAAIRGPQS